jgi:chaperonin GroEL
MSKLISFGEEAREKIKVGIDKMADAVGATLGPGGRNVIVQRDDYLNQITKDGVTVAKNIKFADPYEDLGAQILKQVAIKTVGVAGDGTTTSIVLARAIYSEGLKHVKEGKNAVEIKRGIDLASKEIIKDLEKHARKVKSIKDIKNVATIASNGDSVVGNLIAEAYKTVSKDGLITIADSGKEESYIDITEGYEFMNGYLRKEFINVPTKKKVEYENPFVLISDKKLDKQSELLPILEKMMEGENSLVIITKDMSADILAWLAYWRIHKGFKITVTKGPAWGDRRLELLEDLAVYTGAKLYTQDDERIQTAHIGQCAKVVMTDTHTTLIEGYGEREDINARIDYIKALKELPNFGNSGYQMEKLQERISKLGAQIAVIRVGGNSELEVNELKDRVEDAVQATRCAVKEGILPGGGIALLHSSEKGYWGEYERDTLVGRNIVVEACKAPFLKILENAGVAFKENITEQLDTYEQGFHYRNGYSFNYIKAGIIDPLTVVKSALRNACSIAGLLLTTECVVVNMPDKEQEAFFKQFDFNEEEFEN